MSRTLLQEKPDFIRYEDNEQIIILFPSEWTVVRKDKETDEKVVLGRTETLEQAKFLMSKIINNEEKV